MPYADFRSDTVTKPTEEMRKVIAAAEVGDDIYKDDPTVNELERLAAELTDKEAALFVPSGTMGNQICIKAHTAPGDEIMLHTDAHIYIFEAGATAALSGVMTRLIDGEYGVMDICQIKARLQPGDMHHAPTRLICMENTHNVAGGTVVPLENMREIYNLAKENDINVHLDGARIFNAATALNIEVKEIAAYCDSLMFCLSKGLGAPVGSMICGTHAFIERAMVIRKMFGGALRQSGILAAAGIYALQTMPPLLKADHDNAQAFASALYGHKHIDIDLHTVQTNMVNVVLKGTSLDGSDVSNLLREKNILVNGDKGSKKMRFVFHRDVTKTQTLEAAEALSALLQS